MTRKNSFYITYTTFFEQIFYFIVFEVDLISTIWCSKGIYGIFNSWLWMTDLKVINMRIIAGKSGILSAQSTCFAVFTKREYPDHCFRPERGPLRTISASAFNDLDSWRQSGGDMMLGTWRWFKRWNIFFAFSTASYFSKYLSGCQAWESVQIVPAAFHKRPTEWLSQTNYPDKEFSVDAAGLPFIGWMCNNQISAQNT